jgi:hemerythrin-like domain-containing protein
MTDTGEMLVIHAMFRRQLGELPDLIRAAAGREPAVSDHLRLILDVLHGHHTAEDTVLWPLLEQRAPAASAAIVALMTDQHQAVDRLTDQVREADAGWRRHPGPAAADRLAGLVEDLAVTLDRHLETEEREVLPLAARTVTQAEWGRIGQDGGGHRFTPRQMALLIEMLAEAGDPVVVARMRREIPAPIRFLVDRLAPGIHRRHVARLHGR